MGTEAALVALLASMAVLAVAAALILPGLRAFSWSRRIASILCPVAQLAIAALTYLAVSQGRLGAVPAAVVAGCTLACAPLDALFFRTLAVAERADVVAEEAALVREQLAVQERHAQALRELSALTGALQRQTSSSFRTVADALERGEAAEALALLGAGEQTASQPCRLCAHPVVDALLAMRMDRCRDLGIRWECRAEVPSRLALDNVDVCMLLSGLIDNAVDGARVSGAEEPFVRVDLRLAHGFLAVRVEGSRNADSDAPGMGHGGDWDTRIAEGVARRHDGELSAGEKNGVWRADAMLAFDARDDQF